MPHPSAVCSGPALIELNLSSGHKVTLTHNCQTNALICQNSVSGKIIHNSSIPLSVCMHSWNVLWFLAWLTLCRNPHCCCCLDLIKCKRTLILGSVLLFLITYFPVDLRVLVMYLQESEIWHSVCFLEILIKHTAMSDVAQQYIYVVSWKMTQKYDKCCFHRQYRGKKASRHVIIQCLCNILSTEMPSNPQSCGKNII